jgi:AcrR family transcriptional regulator
MSKKYNPKQTFEKIVTVSTELFIKQGFDKTSMQEIVDALGMSKGAIFHHFKSKEEILYAVMEKHYNKVEEEIYGWLDEIQGVTAKEKLRLWLEKTVRDVPTHPLDNIISPHMVLGFIQYSVSKMAPHFAAIIKDGLADGSMVAKQPDECAEMLCLLLNFWCDSTIFECELDKLRLRLKYLQNMMKLLGADIISDEFIRTYMEHMEEINV